MVGTAQAVRCADLDSDSSGSSNISVTCLYNLMLMVLDILGEFPIQASNIVLRVYHLFMHKQGMHCVLDGRLMC